MDVFEQKYTITVGDVDAMRHIKPSILFDYFQSATTEHGEETGVGLDAMQKAGQGWMLSRFTVLIEKRPRFGQTLNIRTWPQGFDRLFCMRNYEVEDEEKNIIVRGRSAWLVLDIARRRPLRPSSLIVPLQLNEGRAYMEDGALAVESLPALPKTSQRKALYSDIDYNGHVNNARYIQWIQDALCDGQLENAQTIRLDINWLNEIVLGETVDICSAPLEGTPFDTAIALEGRKQSDKQPAFRAELKYSTEQ
jgi:acyl-ACP thioesterase